MSAWDELRPYREVSEQEREVLRRTYAHLRESPDGEGKSGRHLRYEAGVDRETLDRLVESGLLQRRNDSYSPTMFGLLYLGKDGERDLDALDRIVRLSRERYHPDAHQLDEAELVRETELSPAELRRLAKFAEGVRGLDLHVGPNGVHLQLDEEGATSLREILAGESALLRERAGGRIPVERGPFDLRLRGLHIERFRALAAVSIRLPSALTVLVGPNGVGKSSVLDTVRFVACAVSEGLGRALEQEGGLERLRARGTSGSVAVTLDLDVDLGDGWRRGGSYGFRIENVHGQPLVESERLELQALHDSETRLEGARAVTRVRHEDGTLDELLHSPAELGLPLLSDRRSDVEQGIRQDLAYPLLIDRDPSVDERERGYEEISYLGARAKRRTASLRQVLDSAITDDDAEQEIGRAIAQLVPSIAGVHRIVRAGERTEFEVVERGLPEVTMLEELSAGTRQLLMLAALLVHPSPPPILLIEEPDAGVHVGVYPALRDLLRSLSKRSTVLATTHAPAFVGMLDHEKEIVALERDETGVHARSLAEALRSRRWLESFGTPAEAFMRYGMERGS